MVAAGRGLVLGSAVMLAACEQESKEKATPPPPLVTVSKPIHAPYQEYDEYTARVSAVDSVDLRARVGGYLKAIHFSDGDFVKEGDLLFTIDQSTFEAEVNRSKAALERAKAAEALALATLERNKPLISQGVISQQEFDVFSAQYVASQADTLSATAALELNQLNLNFTEIKAPFAGRISDASMGPGNLVLPDSTLLATIVSQDPMFVVFDIDENALLRYRANTPPEVKPEDRTLRSWNLPVSLALGNSTEFTHTGMLDYGDPKVDERTGTLKVRGKFDNKDRALVAGLFGRVRVSLGKPRDVVQIPLRAIGTDQNRKFVYVIDDKGAAQYREVTLGQQSTTLAVVEKGLEPTDTVVIDGILRLRPGVAPEVKEADLTPFLKEAQPAETAPAAVVPPAAETAPAAPAAPETTAP